MAVTGMNEHELRTFYFAPGTTTAMEGAGAPGPVAVAGPAGAASSVGTWKPDLQAMQFAPFSVGVSGLAASEVDDKTYRVHLQTLTSITATTFAPRSGTAVVQDAAGNTYIAGAQVFTYDQSGHLTGVLEIPERPSSLAFGGGRRTNTLHRSANRSLRHPNVSTGDSGWQVIRPVAFEAEPFSLKLVKANVSPGRGWKRRSHAASGSAVA